MAYLYECSARSELCPTLRRRCNLLPVSFCDCGEIGAQRGSARSRLRVASAHRQRLCPSRLQRHRNPHLRFRNVARRKLRVAARDVRRILVRVRSQRARHEREPDPFVLTAGGAPPSPGHSARYFGTLGDNRPPYSWAQLQVFLNPQKSPADLRAFRSLRFWAKGDGGRYSVVLAKQTVTDYDHFQQDFVVSSDWSQVALPLSRFAQAGWGKKQPAVFDDVTQIQFSPAAFSHPFDLSIDHVELSPEDVVSTPIAYDTSSWFPYRGTIRSSDAARRSTSAACSTRPPASMARCSVTGRASRSPTARRSASGA